jgi:hypothetical protein
VELPLPDEPIVGAAEVHRLLKSWRASPRRAEAAAVA